MMMDLIRRTSGSGSADQLNAADTDRIERLLACASRGSRMTGHRSKRRPEAAERLRAAAHGAFREVVNGGPAALDAACECYEAENESLRRRLALQTEVLKLLRSYSTDSWLRSMARMALESDDADLTRCMPDFLHDPSIADAILPSDGDHGR